MPAISGSTFRRTLREQHLAQKYTAGKSDLNVVPMEQHLRVVTAHKRPPSRAWTSLWALNERSYLDARSPATAWYAAVTGALLYDVGPPCRPRAQRTEDSTRAQYRHTTPPRISENGCTSSGPCDERGARAPQDESSRHDCPAGCDYGVRELEHGYRDPRVESGYEREEGARADKERARPPLSAPRTPTVLRRPRRERSIATLAPAPDGIFEDGRCTTSGGRTRAEGAELAHPRDWPVRRGYEVRELERDGETTGTLGHGREEMARRNGSGARAAEHDVREEDRPGRGCGCGGPGKALHVGEGAAIVARRWRDGDAAHARRRVARCLHRAAQWRMRAARDARASLAPVLLPLELEPVVCAGAGCGDAGTLPMKLQPRASWGIAPSCRGVCIVIFLIEILPEAGDVGPGERRGSVAHGIL
ncbi:hypothetical protein B0H13DRAFT_2279911 [Mycena leptocephala]|nr:hypothetical protein B0H13DRAFT_2279911 [Mycena leptocephala]